MAARVPPKEHQFKPGKSGNPKGRPPKIPQLDILLAKVLGDEQTGITAAEGILMALRAKAAKGDVRAAEVLLDRAYGKAKQVLDLESGGEPLSFTVKVANKETADEIAKLKQAAKKKGNK